MTTTIDLTLPLEDWSELPCPEGLAAAQAWAVERGYPLNAVPITKETVLAAGEAGVDAWFAVHLLDRDTAIEVGLGYRYAFHVDCHPRDDTRAGAIAEGNGYLYARWVDRCPRDDTRQACLNEGFGYIYALNIDQAPRNDTREAAIKEGNGYRYMRYVDKEDKEDAP